MRVTVSFFRKYAGGTLVDTSSMSILFNHFELPLKLAVRYPNEGGCVKSMTHPLFCSVLFTN